jgi:hypothetical protein
MQLSGNTGEREPCQVPITAYRQSLCAAPVFSDRECGTAGVVTLVALGMPSAACSSHRASAAAALDDHPRRTSSTSGADGPDLRMPVRSGMKNAVAMFTVIGLFGVTRKTSPLTLLVPTELNLD